MKEDVRNGDLHHPQPDSSKDKLFVQRLKGVWDLLGEPDISLLTETWLKKTISDSDVSLNGFNLYRMDRSRRGGWEELLN